MADESTLTLENLTKQFPAAAEYLIEMFIINRDYGIIKNSVMASRLGVSKPAVTQAMNRLKKYNLIEQDLYGAIKMTEPGWIIAARLLKRHYLLENLLVKTLNYQWEKSDQEASRLQAAISDDFTCFLYDALEHPETCPHGNPMPGSKREEEILAAPRLIKAEEGETLKVARITEEGEAAEGLLDFCYRHTIRPGSVLEVIEADKEKGIRIRKEGETELLVPPEYARYICCFKKGDAA